MSFEKGQTVEYLSKTLGKWYRCEVVDVRGDGALELSCKPNFWIPHYKLSSCVRPVDDEAPLDDGTWAAGDEVEYYSRSHRKWVPTTVLEVREDGAIQVDVKAGHWIDRAEQEEKVRPVEGKPDSALLVTNTEISEEMVPDSAVVGPPAPDAKIRAVLTWNAYNWPPLTSQGWGPIDTDKGGAVWRQFLHQAGCTDIHELQNQQCTKQGLIDAIVKVGHECEEQDVFVFIYTGHGAQSRGTDHHEVDGMDECICCVSADGQRCTEGDWLHDDDIAGCICKHVKAKTVALLVDACHSKTIADFNKPLWAEQDKTAFSITGCSDNQESAATGMGGVFTRAMDQASQSMRGQPINVAAMYNHVLQTARPLQQQFPSTRTGQNISISCPEHIAPQNVEWPLSYK